MVSFAVFPMELAFGSDAEADFAGAGIALIEDELLIEQESDGGLDFAIRVIESAAPGLFNNMLDGN